MLKALLYTSSIRETEIRIHQRSMSSQVNNQFIHFEMHSNMQKHIIIHAFQATQWKEKKNIRYFIIFTHGSHELEMIKNWEKSTDLLTPQRANKIYHYIY